MSINQVQIKNIMDLVSQSYFVGGINPKLNDILYYLNKFFTQHPIGMPYSIKGETYTNDSIADPEQMNYLIALMIANIDVLYEAVQEDLSSVLVLNTLLRSHLERLKIKSSNLETRIQDFLLGNFNTDGYFYSFSDHFNDLSNIDLDKTSCFVDTIAGVVSLPNIASMSKTMAANMVGSPNISLVDENNQSLVFSEKTPFFNCLDGLSNTAWYLEVTTHDPRKITAQLSFSFPTTGSSFNVSRIDVIPYGVSPVSCGINASFGEEVFGSQNIPFTSAIKSSTEKMVFIGDNIGQKVVGVDIFLTKPQHDYITNDTNGISYTYIFGLKELSFVEQVYDQFATMISQPISIPSELLPDTVIDSVSLTTEMDIPSGTEAKFYVAANAILGETSSDYNWREITPLGQNLGINKNYLVKFDGSFQDMIEARRDVTSTNDVQLIEFNSTSSDLSKRNPSPVIVPTQDIYRLFEFDDTFLAGDLQLEEGINTLRIYHTELNDNAVSSGFAFWKEILDDPSMYISTYGRIDLGHNFLYGGDIGEAGRSVYAEAFVEISQDYPIILKECLKADSNSRVWDMRIFLNGREVANMPNGVDKLSVPWKFVKGRNHIAVLVNIPEATVEYPTPYIGTVNLMTDNNLYDYGVVKLDTWIYSDLYSFQNNQSTDVSTFTIYNGEIISRRKPTDNFRLSYNKPTATAPNAIRFRIDMSRSDDFSTITPIIDSYRLRFSYS